MIENRLCQVQTLTCESLALSLVNGHCKCRPNRKLPPSKENVFFALFSFNVILKKTLLVWWCWVEHTRQFAVHHLCWAGERGNILPRSGTFPCVWTPS